MRPVLVSVTFPNLSAARRTAKILLEEKLAVCLNLFPVESHYLWRGKIERAKEVLLFIKTTQKHGSRVEKEILKNHPYEVPCVEAWPLRVNVGCRKWLREML